MFFVIPIRTIVDQTLVEYPWSHVKVNSPNIPDEETYIEALVMMVRVSVSKCIGDYSQWSNFPVLTPFEDHPDYNYIYPEVLHLVWDYFPEQFKGKGWLVLHERHYKESIIVEVGEDYRILDWTNRMTSGEWE